jgi:hypothetical protein
MKKVLVGLTVLTLIALGAIAYADGPGWYGMGPGMMGPGYGYGGYGMGPGMMGPGYGYGGYGMGPGMMGPGYGYGGYGMGPGMMGPGYGYRGYGPRRGYIQSEECQKFLDDTSQTRKELHNKRYDYFEAVRNPKSTPETIAKLEREIRELQEKLYEKAPEGCGW